MLNPEVLTFPRRTVEFCPEAVKFVLRNASELRPPIGSRAGGESALRRVVSQNPPWQRVSLRRLRGI
jgi:hypothetical protein